MIKENKMEKDIKLFSDASNYLVFLTTKDEYGSSRTKDIETYKDYADELNSINLVPKKGLWTESSIKQFCSRMKGKYKDHDLLNHIDLEYVGRSSWEYQSFTIEEEMRNSKKQAPEEYEKRSFYPYEICGRNYNDLELWSKVGADDPDSDYWKIMKNFKKI